ncbi:hypothetical protein [Xylophilus ampelinus]|uniref:Uncharacterized protein n=1 Tax=Xylophilus ampelinus TaxID=54067 RepID=A0A318SRL9_9BURK|nr:hypothetical protein [Xylophilus ampelinus]MCS4509132.1 hypothetical protein [Xylophilus ampelinus]PYE79840.1 hypothetical protein DFQ15_101160 [Xylophilus ampelinus]
MATIASTTPVTTTITKSAGSTSTHSTVTYNTSKTQDTVVHTVNDDGTGTFGALGTINYAGKSLNVRLLDLSSSTSGYKSDHEDAATFEDLVNGSGGGGSTGSKGGEYVDAAVSEQLLAASTVTVSYAKDFASPQAGQMSFVPGPITIDLVPYSTDYIVPGSVRFTWMGHVYEDYDGVIVRDRSNASPGFVAGQLDYSAGVARVFDYVVGGPATAFTLDSCWTVRQNWTTASIFFRTQAAPLKPTGVTISLTDTHGNAITAIGDVNGNIDGLHLRGKLDYESGVGELQFGDFVFDIDLTPAQKLEWWYSADDVGAVQAGKIWRPWPVDPTTLRYNSVAYFYLPLDAELLGVDPVRLPPDGRVTIFQPGFRAVVGHTGSTAPAALSAGQTINVGRVRLSRARVIGADGRTINTGYTVDLEAGKVAVTDVTGWAQPVHIEHRVEDMVVVSDVGIDGTLRFNRQLTHAYPVPGSYVSSALMAGDLRARVSKLFDQASWNGATWSDAVGGDTATATYNDAAYPIEVTNAGAMTERWGLRFTSSTAFVVVGEHVGQIAAGSIVDDCSPVNPITGEPYFTVRALGWGTGWAAGNALRINTIGAIFTVDVIRTVQAGPEAGLNYRFSLLTRGDVDRP